ncbi:MAG: helix-turn-helix transcriptional regulator [Rubrivivax sp.]
MRRIEMLRAGGDLDGAAETLGQEVPTLLTGGALAAVSHLVDQFPGPFVAASPVMQQALGLAAWARWDCPAMLQAMQRAEPGFVAAGDADRARAAAAYQSLALNALGRNAESATRLTVLRRESLAPTTRVVVLVACTWHALDLNATTRIGPLQDELMDLLERNDDPSLWYRGPPLPRINGLPGTAAALQRYVQGALRLAGERPMPLRALGHTQAGWHQAWQVGDLEAAEDALATAQDDSRWLGDPVNVKGQIQLLAAFVHTMRGNRARALAAAQVLVDDHPPGRGGWSLWANVYYAARIAARFDERALFERHLARIEQAASGVSAPATQMPLLGPLQAQRAWLAGDREGAIAPWQHALADEAAIDRLGHAVEARLWLAAALLEGGRAAEANETLRPLADRRLAGAGVGGVLFARPAAERLLAAGARAGLAPELGAQLRGWLAVAEPASPPPATVPLQPGGLSGREMEVLERIAAGDSNKLIARAFDLSPHTVKRHVANILDKLGAESRGQAAAWYRRHA